MPSPELKVWNPPRWSQKTGSPVIVGGRTFMIPNGWKAAQAGSITYLLGRDGLVYALTERGEVQVPKRVQGPLKKKHFTVTPTPAVAREKELVAATARLERLASR